LDIKRAGEGCYPLRLDLGDINLGRELLSQSDGDGATRASRRHR